MNAPLSYWYAGCREGQPIRMACGCLVRTPRGLGRGKPRMRRVEELTKLRCHGCAETHIRAQAKALTDPDGKPLSKADREAYEKPWLSRIADRPPAIQEDES